VVTLLVLSVFFRFANIDTKIYWYDETHTSLRVSGYTEAEAVQFLSKNQIITSETLQTFQRPNPERGISKIVQNFATEDAQHPPLYYLMSSVWMKWFGNSVAVRRSLSAFISLLSFPAIYWLCLELFQSSMTGAIAIGLIAISPIQVLYAQEARQYSLWTVTILLSSAALLRAMRLKTKGSWVIYAVTALTSLYTFLFSGLVLVGHGLYVMIVERFRASKTFIAYLLASLATLLLFLPWLLVVVQGVSKIQTTTAWTANNMTLPDLIREWIRNLARIFIDWNYESTSPFISKVIFYLSTLALLLLVGYSFYFLCRYTPKRTWLFVVILTGCLGVPLALSDLFLGGTRSTIGRYLFPCFLGIQLTVAYTIATKLSASIIKNWQQKLWQTILFLVVSGGVVSCVISSQSEVWWTKYYSNRLPAVAEIINQSPNPLLISDSQTGDLLTLSYLLKPNVSLIVNPLCTNCGMSYPSQSEAFIPQVSGNFSDIFFFNLDGYRKWLDKMATLGDYKIVTISPNLANMLWKLEKK
jgi:uncharacterized membrane protein